MKLDTKVYYSKHLIFLFLYILLIVGFAFFRGVVISFTVSMLIFCLFMLKLLKNFEDNIIMLCFGVSLFTFLIAAPFAELILRYESKYTYLDSARNHFYITLGISILGLYIGYFVIKVKFANRKTYILIATIDDLEYISKYAFLVTYTIKIAQYFEILFNTITRGYMYYYTDYTSVIPQLLIKFSDMYIVCLAVYLACMPPKNKGIMLLKYYCFGACIVGLGGRRSEMVIAFIVSIVYCIIRNRNEEKGEKWIKKRTMVLILVLSPFILLILMIIGANRSLNTYGFISLKRTILDFMIDVGNSGKVVMRAYENKDIIPKGKLYSFGSLIEYFKYNEISKLIFGTSNINARTYDYAMNGHSLSYLITYLFSQESFYSGHGQGSCYIAELYADFNYVGVFIGSILLGYFISVFGKFIKGSVFHNAITIFVIPAIIHMPRDTYCLPLTYIINFKYLFAFILLLILSNLRSQNKI